MKHLFSFSTVNRLQKFLIAALCGWAVCTSTLAAERLVITEFLADNNGPLLDADGDESGWIEIYNADTNAVNLAGWYLTDDPAILDKWTFPATNLGINRFLLVFASGKNRAVAGAELHANFSLDNAGEYLALVAPDGQTVAHQFAPVYPPQLRGVSYGAEISSSSEVFVPSGAEARWRVPTGPADLPVDWTATNFAHTAWSTGRTGLGFDVGGTNSLPPGTSTNLALGKPTTQSSTASTFNPDLAVNGNLGDFTHTAAGQNLPATWEVNLGTNYAIERVVLHNRSSCCGSRLRDITVRILSADGTATQYTSALLNPENALGSGLNGPASLTVDLVSLTGGPVSGGRVRVTRTPDPDLSGTGGQGNNDEADVLSLGEVEVFGGAFTSYYSLIQTDVGGAMKGSNATALARLPFVIPVEEMPLLDWLTLRMKYDDGFVAYLNGVEVARRNAPATLAWNSAATAEHPGTAATQFEEIDLTAFLGLLQEGENVLAIQGLNTSATDGDFLLVPELEGRNVRTMPGRYFAQPSPGAANLQPYVGFVADTKFSVDRGFFTAPFSVAITTETPGAEIRYTTNGSAPDAVTGLLYTGPIPISRTTVLRAIATKPGYRPTNVDTHTYIYLSDILAQRSATVIAGGFPSTWPGTTPDYEMDPRIIGTNTPQVEASLLSLPSVFITTSVSNLFDGTTGIYTHPTSHGIAWERPASVEMVNTNATTEFQVNCGLRIQGGAFRSFGLTHKKSFRVLFKDEYGPGKLRHDLFKKPTAVQEFDGLVFRAGANDGYTWGSAKDTEQYTRDQFGRQLQLDMGQPAPHGLFMHVYLNGVYWGLYNLIERANEDFSASYFGGVPEEWDSINAGEIKSGDRQAWDTMIGLATQSMSLGTYERLQGNNADGSRQPAYPVYLDMVNYIDYMIVNIWGGNWDWPNKNFWFGRKRTPDSTGFKFYTWDFENTMGNDRNRSPLNMVSPRSGIENSWVGQPHYSLKNFSEYRMDFADRVHRYFFNNGVLTPVSLTNRYRPLADWVERAIIAESARWGDDNLNPPQDQSDWFRERDWLLGTYLAQRSDVVLQQFRTAGLYPAVSAPVFSQFGGILTNQVPLALSHNNGVGTIYYTLDGTDPRLIGGTVNPAALSYSSPVAIGANSRVKARVLSGATWSALVEADFAVPGVLPLRITEIMYHPAPVTAAEAAQGYADPELFEYLELRNIGSQAINLAGISFVNGITFTFTQGTLAAGQRLVLVKNPAAFALRYGAGATVAGYFEGNLRNSGERVVLQDALGQIIHDFSYADNWVPLSDGFGFSLGIVDETAPLYTWDSSANWQSSAALGGSPGSENPLLPAYPSVFINELLANPLVGGKVTVELANVGSSPADVSDWWLSDDFRLPKKFRLPPDTIIPAGGFVTFTEDDFNAPGQGTNAFNFSLGGGEARLFSADGNGNLTGYYQGWDYGASDSGVSFGRVVTSTGSDQFVAQQAVTLGDVNAGPLVGPVVIHEIMYHPPDIGTNDNSLDEFIELLNVSSNTVLLYAPLAPINTWRISGGVDFNLPLQLQLAPGQYLLLVNFSPADGVQLEAFRTKYAVPAGTAIYGPYSGKLDNSSEPVELKRPMRLPNGVAVDVLVDKVRYEDYAPWPCNTDGTGKSLQRLAGDAYGNDPINWIGSLPTAGRATVPEPPGLATIAQEPVDLVVRTNSQAIFIVQACAPGQAHYQWLYNGTLLDDATNALLVLDNVETGDSGTYQVVITTAGGSVTSRVAELIVQTPPWIEVQPQGQTVLGYTPATFAVAAGGIAPFGYQWRFNGADLPGETNATLVLPPVENAQEGEYRVLIYNTAGTVLSAAANLTVNLPAHITEQPEDIVTTNSYNVALMAAATGDGTVTWQWYFRGGASSASPTAINGANSPALSFNNISPTAEGQYFAVVSNAYGSDTSRVAQLTVLVMPSIVEQPQSRVIGVGETLNLNVVVEGSQPMGYRWRRNSITVVPFEEGTERLVIPRMTLDDYGSYMVIVTNAARLTGVGSRNAYVTVVQPPPNRMVLAGSSVTLAATVAGTGTHLYRWQYAGVDIPGATSPSLALVDVQTNQSGTYTLMVSNTVGLVANHFSCSLTVQETATPPEILEQPSNVVAVIDEPASFAIEAIGTEPLVYQWFFNETNLLADATNALLTIGTVQEANLGDYTVVVSNQVGVVTSAVARLSVGLPDRDGDGLPDDFEIAHGLNPDSAADGDLDTDRDGLTNAQEYRAGTNPTNAASALKLEMPEASSGPGAAEVTLRFSAVSNRSYTIEFRDRLNIGPWQEALSLEAALTNRTVEVTNTLGTGTQRYYRIGTPKPQ